MAAFAKLKMTTESVHKVEWHVLEDFIIEVYGVTGYSFQADQEAGNDTVHEFSVSDNPLDEYSLDRLTEWIGKNAGMSFMTDVILNDMCYLGFIPAGTYLVNISY